MTSILQGRETSTSTRSSRNPQKDGSAGTPTCSARGGQQRRKKWLANWEKIRRKNWASQRAPMASGKGPGEPAPALSATHKVDGTGRQNTGCSLRVTRSDGVTPEHMGRVERGGQKRGIGSGSEQPSEKPCSAWSAWRGMGIEWRGSLREKNRHFIEKTKQGHGEADKPT